MNPNEEANSHKNHASRGPNVTISLFLISLGIILLLSNLGVITAINWDNVIPYWPFLLIILGSENLLSGTPWGRGLAFAVAAAVVIGIVFVATQYRAI